MSRTTVRRWWVVTVFFALSATVALAQAPKSDDQATGVAQQVREAQQQMLDAAIRGDKDAVGRYIADDLTWVNANGQINGKDQVLGMLPAPVNSVDVDRVLLYGKSAVLVGVAHLKSGTDAHFLQEWVSADGQWKLKAHQGVTAASTSAASGNETMGAPTGTAGTMGTTEAHTPAKRTEAPALRSPEERAIWKAQMELQHAFLKGDAATYGKYTGDNYVRITPEGMQNRDEWLQVVAKNRGQSAGDLAVYDAQITVYGDTARVVQETSGRLPGGDAVPPTRFTRIFEKTNGQWRQVAAAFTPIKEQ